MNYINLFRKLAYKDKDIDYFRGLPGEEGKLFMEMYSWLNMNWGYVKEGKAEYIKNIFNRIRANYLGIIYQEIIVGKAATEFQEDGNEEALLTAAYLIRVVDHTKFGELNEVAKVILQYFNIPRLPFAVKALVRPQGDIERFESSFKPEIENWEWRSKLPPARWTYWENILGNNFFLGKERSYKDIDFIVGLFTKKQLKLAACDALKEAIKQGYKKHIL